jgi:hypothetical protein
MAESKTVDRTHHEAAIRGQPGPANRADPFTRELEARRGRGPDLDDWNVAPEQS